MNRSSTNHTNGTEQGRINWIDSLTTCFGISSANPSWSTWNGRYRSDSAWPYRCGIHPRLKGSVKPTSVANLFNIPSARDSIDFDTFGQSLFRFFLRFYRMDIICLCDSFIFSSFLYSCSIYTCHRRRRHWNTDFRILIKEIQHQRASVHKTEQWCKESHTETRYDSRQTGVFPVFPITIGSADFLWVKFLNGRLDTVL